jgi:hypothetical protein
MRQISTSGGDTYNLLQLPDKCPFCHNAITPNVLFGHIHHHELEVTMYCPNEMCNRAFIGYYQIGFSTSAQFLGQTTMGTLEGKIFSKEISEISPSFVIIYNQAYIAEQQDLKEICGVGYRKALEFLIKDYVIKKLGAEKEKVEKAFLGIVINDFVNDTRIQSVSKRAVWLGNDETHYIRKWEGKNLDDLKKLIDLTVHWIEMEALTSNFEADMPE